jgi:hypothetical protein
MRTVNEPTFDDLLFVASWMCKADQIELALTRDPTDYVKLAHDAWESRFKFVVLDEALPVMAFGAKPINRTALVWGFKTDKGWPAVLTATKYIKRIMIPALRDAGVRKAVCLVHPNNWSSQSWLRHLGFHPEATTREFGTRHEEVILYQRDEPDVPDS